MGPVFDLNAIALAVAAFGDFCLGDPWGWPHPVQLMGGVITVISSGIIRTFAAPALRRWGGVFLGIFLIVGSAWLGWILVYGLTSIHWGLGFLLEVILLASCLAGRSLRNAAADVLQPLRAGDLEAARAQLSRYVGRDTAHLGEGEILRAVLETVAENAVDGVTAPFFYAILGAFIPPVGVVPLALAYKAASTLDSMIGYTKEPYRDIGWFSAKAEDIFTWIPCRLTVITLALLSGRPKRVLSLCQRDAPKDPSPNSGWSEAVYGAILGVQLGGENTYQGVVKVKPLLGDPLEPITAAKVAAALNLTRTCFLVWLALALIALGLGHPSPAGLTGVGF
jgi:adenosylcobinamide-phosphate synthase